MTDLPEMVPSAEERAVVLIAALASFERRGANLLEKHDLTRMIDNGA